MYIRCSGGDENCSENACYNYHIYIWCSGGMETVQKIDANFIGFYGP
jgi:hypothetical protein